MLFKTSMADSTDHKLVEMYSGGYNDLPDGWAEINAEEFAKEQLLYVDAVFSEYRQMLRPEDKSYLSATLHHFRHGAGYAICSDYHTGRVHFYRFNCLDKLKELYGSLGAVSDTGWATTHSYRCIKDYNRIIGFDRELSDIELKLLVTYLYADHCPGWTGISTYKVGNNQYSFNTTYDSSD